MSAHINTNNNKKKEHKQMTRKKKKKKKKQISDERYILKKPKNTETFTHLYNKYYNIFTKYLFSAVVGNNFIFYYFISTYKKLTP